MASLKWLLSKIDNFQQKHRPLAFGYAVIKKYSEDEGSRLGAIITYYTFLSLFPLLLVTTSATQLLLKNNEHLRERVADGVGHYFPVLSSHLQSNIHSIQKTGLALILGVVVLIYGTKGGADAIQYALNKIWRVPEEKHPTFPRSALRSMAIIFGGGGGLVLASILSSYAAGLAHVFIFRLVPILISFFVSVGAFYLIFKFGIASRFGRKFLLTSAVWAATGALILQATGFYLITRQLANLNNLYGTFAIVLGLIFWIYLQVQVFLYAVEAGSVRAHKLWPRGLMTDSQTK